ncbi:MAG: hypothetical protein GTN93_00680, partial [Anaerolineae bacterium]|nr:hypothetical protein [Anaerolineae bacterium]
MKQFLSLIEPLLAASQAERLAAIIRKRQAKEGAGTPAETQEELSRLLQMTEKTSQLKPAFTVRPPMFDREVMDGDHFNSHMEAFEIDVHNLYEMANNLTGSTLGMQNILHSRIESFRAQLCRLSDDIFSYQHLKNTDGFARVITQGFADGRNPTMAGVPARVDPQTRSLKLPATEQTRHHQERGIQPAQVVVTNLSAGLTGVASRTFEEENAIDPDPESFWAEVLLASGPLQTDYTFLSGATQTFPGALVQVNLVLGSPEFVSDVKILPFGDYPVRVVDVKYKQSGNEFQFPGYVDRNPSLNWLEWHGLRVLADEIIFVLQQETYTKVRYHIPKLTVALTSFWEQLLDEETRLVIEDQNLTDFQKQKAEADARFSSLWEGMRKYGLELERRDIPAPDPLGQTIPSAEVLHRTVDAASQAMTGDPEQKLRLRSLQSEKEIDQSKLVEIERYEYVFGAREL